MTKTTNISIRIPDDMLVEVDRIRDDLQADALPGQTYTRTNVILWAIEGLIKRDPGLELAHMDLDMSEPHKLD